MSEDRVAVLEQKVEALQREVAALRAALRTGRKPYVSLNPNDPLEGHPLLSKKMSPEEAAEYEARRLKELGLENVPLISVEELRQMMIDNGVDPNSNEASRELIAMREEEG
jgi:hypothetical protein